MKYLIVSIIHRTPLMIFRDNAEDNAFDRKSKTPRCRAIVNHFMYK